VEAAEEAIAVGAKVQQRDEGLCWAGDARRSPKSKSANKAE
jgi:hypothetical protein